MGGYDVEGSIKREVVMGTIGRFDCFRVSCVTYHEKRRRVL